MTTASSNAHLYAKNFWSVDDSAPHLLMNHFHQGTKTFDTLSLYYKERASIEEEYTRKLNSLTRKLGLSDHEKSSTLRDSLETLSEETKQLGVSHLSEASKITESILKPLEEFSGDMKARAKATESNIQKMVKHKKGLEAKVEHSRQKYESLWTKINSAKTEQILLDEREATRLQTKIIKLQQQMIQQRSEYYKLCKDYNTFLETWKDQWYLACETYQEFEEEKIKFLKKSMWEYANAVSSTCLTADQSCENIRLSLEKCSYKTDIKLFAENNGTGNQLSAPVEFVDYAKGQMPNPSLAISQTIDIDTVPLILKDKLNKQEELSKKRAPPPNLTTEQEIKFDFLERNEETIKILQLEAQEQAQNEGKLSQRYQTESEPSSYKVLSDYSNPTSVSSYEEAEPVMEQTKQFNESLYSNPLLSSTISDEKPTEPINLFRRNPPGTTNSSSAAPTTSSANPLRAYMKEFSMSKFRESMLTVDSPTTHKDKVNDVATKQNHRVSSISRSKSSTTLQNKFINYSNLPSRSSEGYPAIKYSRAQYQYNAEIDQELSFKKKDILMILHQQTDGWWFAENLNTGESGLVPSNYLADL
ncbi:hypothetical protein CANARDRAFT_202526 [[Candida] arabinofermentans NRRL YB-2248]|uniref:SH3 domain-containing protein n=1 Tax=[Candida] arabinofermentans NRRL YB-2248 TaxID=983967 RepID=A0A1E4SWC2_9ASCO|nr:hypothetical protein CANARDRAFT_202526 [[Candida] arabinofermentans NRRL YB-2248]